jgi:hypothetical protein
MCQGDSCRLLSYTRETDSRQAYTGHSSFTLHLDMYTPHTAPTSRILTLKIIADLRADVSWMCSYYHNWRLSLFFNALRKRSHANEKKAGYPPSGRQCEPQHHSHLDLLEGLRLCVAADLSPGVQVDLLGSYVNLQVSARGTYRDWGTKTRAACAKARWDPPFGRECKPHVPRT